LGRSLTKEQLFEKLRQLKRKQIPVIYSISTGLLALRAGGHGLVVEVLDEQVTIEGRSGHMTILFKFAPIESEISGHYSLSDAR